MPTLLPRVPVSHPASLAGLLLAALLPLAGGCSFSRPFNIDTRPAGAEIRIDGAPVGRSPVVNTNIAFPRAGVTHTVTAVLPGYREETLLVRSNSPTDLLLDLRPDTRVIRITVDPVPGYVKINGRPAAPDPVRSLSKELEFTVDGEGRWTTYTITAERAGFQKAERVISGRDTETRVKLELAPVRKDVSISSAPNEAVVYIDGENRGKTPLTLKDMPFTTDPETNQWSFHRLKLVKPGYAPVEQMLSWDDGRADYRIELKAITKTVKIVPAPAPATVTIDGQDYPPDRDGSVTATLPFAPTAAGEPRTYEVVVSRKTATSEWAPETFAIGWDDGRADYPVTLKEVRTSLVEMLAARPVRKDDGWHVEPQVIKTVARKETGEGAGKAQALKLTALPRGTMLDSLSVSRDGLLVFTVLQLQGKTELRSFMKIISTDGTPGVKDISDGRSLDLQPAFTPDGKEIVYSSDRAGRGQNIWKLSASGEGGLTQLTNEKTSDLWPSYDASGRLFYQGLVDNDGSPRVYRVEPGKIGRTEMIAGASQPRVSPDLSSLLVCQLNDKTQKRDIYRLDEKLIPVNITKSPDADEFDAAWSPNGKKVAFASDRGADEDRRNNYDIWIIDLAQPDRPVQVTVNGSWDDAPAWSPKGDAIYFRSNRGGEWAIWRIALPPELHGGTP